MRATALRRSDDGLGSAVLLAAVLPMLVVVFTVCLLVGSRTYAVVRAGLAADAAAAAVPAGGDAEALVMSSLSRRLAADARVAVHQDRVSVSVRALDLWDWGGRWSRVEVSSPIPVRTTPAVDEEEGQ